MVLAVPASEALKMALHNIMVALEVSVDLDLEALKVALPHNITVAMGHSVDLDSEGPKEDLVVPDLEGPKTAPEDIRVFLRALAVPAAQVDTIADLGIIMADMEVIMADMEVIMGALAGQADLRVVYVIAAP